MGTGGNLGVKMLPEHPDIQDSWVLAVQLHITAGLRDTFDNRHPLHFSLITVCSTS